MYLWLPQDMFHALLGASEVPRQWDVPQRPADDWGRGWKCFELCTAVGQTDAEGKAGLGPTALCSSVPLLAGCSSRDQALSATGPRADTGTPVLPCSGNGSQAGKPLCAPI